MVLAGAVYVEVTLWVLRTLWMLTAVVVWVTGGALEVTVLGGAVEVTVTVGVVVVVNGAADGPEKVN